MPLLFGIHDTPWFVERNTPAFVPTRMSEPPAPLGTAIIECALTSASPFWKCSQVTPASLVRQMKICPANRFVPPAPLGTASRDRMDPPLGPLVCTQSARDDW